MDLWTIFLIVVSWYSIVGTIVGIILIILFIYLKYIKKVCVNKLLWTGIALVGITAIIFIGFLLFGFWGLGLAPN
jgi:hypothetical protein